VYKGCVEPGDNVTFEVCVENMGDTPLHEVLVEDTLPECTDFVDPQPPWECVDPPNCRTYKWDIGTLQPTKKECSDLVLNVRSGTPPGDPCPGGSCTVSSKETGKSKPVPQPVRVCGQPAGGGNRPEFDTVGCDATNYFALRDGIMPRVVENAVDALGKKINLYSDFVPQGREYFTQTASDLYPDPCFPGYMSAYVDSSNQGIYEWLIVLQMKPESDIDLNIYDCVMKRYGASVWKSAGQTGWYTTDGGDDPSFWAAANPTVTVAVVPGPYATPGFDAPFYLDGRTLTGLLPVSLVDVPYTSKAFWEEGIVIEMPMTGSINCLGETVYDLKQGDAIKVTISIPTKNTVDIRYGKDNVILKYIGIVATEHCTDDACAQ
ncbi:MAG: DUF11 domain-containing protein, partial [Proteobacteria bacterium]|nr:DUF11 domain-containing protein [Pseudomonadota bacterium]